MKNTLQILLIFFFVLGFQSTTAQDMDLIEGSEAQKEKSSAIVDRFNDRLSLTEKQYLLFKEKQTEFIVKNESVINSTRTPEQANEILRVMYKEQYQEMDDILTERQMEMYREIRPVLDPLIVVNKLEDKIQKTDK